MAKPDGLLVIPAGDELAFLHPLPVERLWGVGPATAEKLHAHGLRTVGQVAAIAEPALVSMLGRGAGRQLHALSHNRDPRRVRRARGRRSFGAQCALGRSPSSPEALDAVLVALVDRVTRRMRAKRRVGRTVALRMRFADFSRATRSHTLSEATATTRTVLAAERALLEEAMPMIEHRGLTLVGVTVSNIEWGTRAMQLALPVDGRSATALDAVLDDVRDRFGATAVTRAVLLGRAPRLATWLFPDEED